MTSTSSAAAQQRRAMELPMAKTFWGVEVKPGQPYVHKPSRGGGLFIRQATIGNNNNVGWTTLECQIGDIGPVRLCALNCTKAFTYELDIEVNESIILSVTGYSSIHLWGYCIHPQNAEDSSLDKNANHSQLRYQGGPSEKNDGEPKRPITIEDEENTDDNHLSDAHRRATKKKCKRTSTTKVLSDENDDITPVNEYNHSTNMTKGSLYTSNTELQGIKKQNSVARDSGSARSGKVHTRKSTSGCKLIIKNLEEGRDNCKIASKGSKVTVEYVGKLLDGNIVDPPGEHKFKLGDGSVILGWELGILGMRVGGKRRLTIPPDFGYGAEGSRDGKVPPNSWLKYEVELTNVEGCQEHDLSFV